MDILIINTDQQHTDQIYLQIAEQNITAKIRYAEDQESLVNALKRASPDIIWYVHAYDVHISQVVKLANEGNPKPLIVFSYNITDANWSAVKQQLLRLNVFLHLDQVDIPHFATIISQAHSLSNLKRKYQQLVADVSQSSMREQQLRKHSSEQAIAIIKDGIHVYTNEVYTHFFGIDAATLLSTPVLDLIVDLAAFKQNLKVLQKGKTPLSTFDCSMRLADGTSQVTNIKLTLIQYEGEQCTQITFDHDLLAPQATKTMQISMPSPTTSVSVQEQAHINAALGIKNKLAFILHLEQLVEQCLRDSSKISGLMVYAIDNLNDLIMELGFGIEIHVQNHFVNLLTAHAKQLSDQAEVFQINDTHYAVCLDQQFTHDIQKRVSAWINHLREQTFNINKRTLSLMSSASLLNVNHFQSADELLKHALQANQTAKANTTHISVYQPSSDTEQGKNQIVNEIRQAIEKNSFTLMYQHLYDTQDDSTTFVEAFVRLKRQDGQSVLPEHFMPTAKQFKLMDTIDQWVILNACKNYQGLLNKINDASLLINVSSGAFYSEKIITLLEKIAGAFGQPITSQIYLQFSEIDIINHIDAAYKQLSHISDMGFKICINNFGCTSQSRSLLSYLPVSLVKIAGELSVQIHTEEGMSTVSNIISGVKSIGVSSIIGFIDNPSAMSVAWSTGARYLQGFFLSELSNTLEEKKEH